jgi:uncharacterized heparinase superfamily protein
VVVRDEIQGRFGRATALYHLHPEVVVRTDPDDSQCMHLDLPERRHALLRVVQGHASVRPATWHPKFGCTIDNQCVVVEFAGRTTEVLISWWNEP